MKRAGFRLLCLLVLTVVCGCQGPTRYVRISLPRSPQPLPERSQIIVEGEYGCMALYPCNFTITQHGDTVTVTDDTGAYPAAIRKYQELWSGYKNISRHLKPGMTLSDQTTASLIGSLTFKEVEDGKTKVAKVGADRDRFDNELYCSDFLMALYAFKPPEPRRTAEQPTVYEHVMYPGETVRDLAAQFDCTVEDILSLNNVKDPASFKSGAKVLLPVPE